MLNKKTKNGGIFVKESNNAFSEKLIKAFIYIIKIVKAFLYTLLITIISIQGIYYLVRLAFTNISDEVSNTWVILCMCMGIIFTIVFCTITILDEIKKKR